MSVSIRILACVSTICNPDDRPEKREAQLASALKRAYNEQFRGYIAGNVTDIVWGSDEPEHIMLAAKSWNNDIVHSLMNAIGSVLTGPADGMWPALDTDRTQELTVAAAAANNEARPNAKQLLFNLPLGTGASWCYDTNWCYECVLSENRLRNIVKHPEDYAVAWLHAD
ncbi:hypothetical protein [Pseudoflavonifractor phocaeensis]|uniref:hypothetical protein n=1 Tax=Pseudoflavonifractor phocaeensis TaxID=1870988 RepID=UPI00195D51CC|nr:hypothetical protein [Pseudoflavonifractor phocaeensis]MBM6887028.1 hypothetical protein [Pseudoflavonifractor phocaeensis]